MRLEFWVTGTWVRGRQVSSGSVADLSHQNAKRHFGGRDWIAFQSYSSRESQIIREWEFLVEGCGMWDADSELLCCLSCLDRNTFVRKRDTLL